MNHHVTIIAEAGVNHNGDLKLAKRLIDVAAEAGADFIKFQTFKANKLASNLAPKAEYQDKLADDSNESQLEMLQKLELLENDHFELMSYCSKKNIQFLSTAFDLESLDFLHKIGMKLFKIPSGEITNLPFLEKVGAIAHEIILSTGMSTIEEIQDAISVLKMGIDTKLTVLHCNTEYPTPFEDVNLLAMQGIAKKFNVEIGYSDHTLGIEVPIAAVALGASIIEKHFTLDRSLPGPDHAASLEPDELKNMVKSIRNIEKALGSEKKSPSPSELKNIEIARKSIHLIRDKNKGEILDSEDLEMLRPGDGISPMKIYQVIGRKVCSNLSKGHKLSPDDLSS